MHDEFIYQSFNSHPPIPSLAKKNKQTKTKNKKKQTIGQRVVYRSVDNVETELEKRTSDYNSHVKVSNLFSKAVEN